MHRFRRIWSRKKVSVLVSENLVLDKSFGFGEFGLGKKVSVAENLVSEKSIVFEEFGLGKKSRFRFQSKSWSFNVRGKTFSSISFCFVTSNLFCVWHQMEVILHVVLGF